MNQHRIVKYFNSILLLVLVALSCGSIQSAKAADEGIKIGVLDENKLSDNFTKYQDAMISIDQKAQTLDEQLKARDLLNAEEGGQFDTLIQKIDRSAEEQAHLEALVKTGNDRRAELLALSGKATRTDDEVKRIADLQETLKANGDAVQKLQDALLKALLEEKRATEKQYTDLANTTVIDVAKDKKLTIVLSRSAIVWSAPSVDITDDVIKKLNKN